MAAASVLRPNAHRHHRDSAFSAVFALPNHTTPTPEATPNIGTIVSPGVAFGGFNIPNNPADHALELNRAWSSATRFLSLPPGSEGLARSLANSPEAAQAVQFLLRTANSQRELFTWYLHEVNTHFSNVVLPTLSFWEHPIALETTAQVLSRTVNILRQYQSLYFDFGLGSDIGGFSRQVQTFGHQVEQVFHVQVWHSLPNQCVQQALASYLFETMKSSLEHDGNSERCIKQDECECQLGLDLNALSGLREVGLGGAHGERALAQAVHRLLQGPALERRCFQVGWTTKQTVIHKITAWASSVLGPSIQQAVSVLTGAAPGDSGSDEFLLAAVESFGRLRIGALFDYANSWPASQGAIDDVKEYLKSHGSNHKAFLCASFSEEVQRRLLHAGASTTEILSMYINVIRVFKVLDNRGVLLDKVAIPIRSYLRSREDTVSTIASSFLLEVDENGEIHGHDPEKVCADIAIELASSTVCAEDHRLLHWNDMSWLPDPIDAGPNYRSTRNDDAVAYVLGLFDPDDFIKALSSAIGHHLIHSTESELIREIRLVELLKSRFDASKLQAAEVMLKDVRDSVHLNKRINPDQYRRAPKAAPKEIQAALPEEGITIHSLYDIFKDRMEPQEFQATLQLVAKRRNDLYFPKRTRLSAEASSPAAPVPEEMRFEAKILSRHFWPQLRDVEFRLPDQVRAQIAKYEAAFSKISGQRKLEWKHGVGTTDLVLELEDRVVEENGVELWKTSIIGAFASHGEFRQQNQSADYDQFPGLSVADLMISLKMDEDYVVSAISFWISKRVLYEKSEGLYAVLERLDLDRDYVEDSSQVDLEILSAVKSEDAMLRENAPVYQRFIEEMLRNSGAKEIEGMMGITNVMKMVMPGFTGGDNEVLWLLEDMQSQNVVTKSGELWAVVE